METVQNLLHPLPHYWRKAFAEFVDMKSVMAILTGIAGFMFPNEAQLTLAVSLFGLVMVDLVTGVYAQVYNRRTLHSSKLRKTGAKLIAYFCLALTIALAFRHIGSNREIQGVLVTTVFTFCIGAEALSIVENISRTRVLPDKVRAWLSQYIQTHLIEEQVPEIVSEEESK